MKIKLLSSLFVCLLSFVSGLQKTLAQIADAGADQQIYLSQTTTAVLNGSKSSGTRYKWTDISTDYPCPGNIISATSKTTKVAGLQQGVFYFQIAVTTSGTTKYDTVSITVDYAPAPATGTLLKDLSTDMANSTLLQLHK